jgi:hypothetical protein
VLAHVGGLDLALEPAAEEGQAHALPLAVAHGVIHPLTRGVGFAHKREARRLLILRDDACESL